MTVKYIELDEKILAYLHRELAPVPLDDELLLKTAEAAASLAPGNGKARARCLLARRLQRMRKAGKVEYLAETGLKRRWAVLAESNTPAVTKGEARSGHHCQHQGKDGKAP